MNNTFSEFPFLENDKLKTGKIVINNVEVIYTPIFCDTYGVCTYKFMLYLFGFYEGACYKVTNSPKKEAKKLIETYTIFLKEMYNK